MKTILIIRERSIASAMIDAVYPGEGPFRVRIVPMRWRWLACLCAWWINTMGAGSAYENAEVRS